MHIGRSHIPEAIIGANVARKLLKPDTQVLIILFSIFPSFVLIGHLFCSKEKKIGNPIKRKDFLTPLSKVSECVISEIVLRD